MAGGRSSERLPVSILAQLMQRADKVAHCFAKVERFVKEHTASISLAWSGNLVYKITR